MTLLHPKPDKTILLVEVPEDAKNICVEKFVGLCYTTQIGLTCLYPLPPGDWQIISTLKDLSEDQARELADAQIKFYEKFSSKKFLFHHALEIKRDPKLY